MNVVFFENATHLYIHECAVRKFETPAAFTMSFIMNDNDDRPFIITDS